MQNKPQIEQKSQEIAFALIRTAAYIRKNELKNRIDALSFKFIQLIAEQRFDESLKSLNALKNLVELGKNLLLIEPINAKILLREIEAFNQVIRQFDLSGPLPDLNSIFSDSQFEKEEIVPIKVNKVFNSAKGDNAATVSKIDIEISKIRQEKILEKIRQAGSQRLQLKGFLAEFPGISERTIRYDLKKLADEGKIERQGSGGPSNYYVLKQQSYPQA